MSKGYLQYIIDESKHLKQCSNGLLDEATEIFFKDLRDWLGSYFNLSLEEYVKLREHYNI
jgi:hypothetical protein